MFDIFHKKSNDSARLASDRLRRAIQEGRNVKNQPSYLPNLKRELEKVVGKYASSGEVSFSSHAQEKYYILNLKITLNK